MEANTLPPAGRGEHSHSTLPLGATRALVSQSDRNAYSAMGGNGLGPSAPSGSNGVWRPTATASPAAAVAAPVALLLAIVPMVCPGSGAGNQVPQDRLRVQGPPGVPGRGQGGRVERPLGGLGDQLQLAALGGGRDGPDALVGRLGGGQQAGGPLGPVAAE